MRQQQSRLESLDVAVVIVTFENTSLAQRYAEKTELRWPLLVDDQRKLYRAYGMEHGGWWNVWGWPAWKIYARLLWKGRRLQKATGDTQQLGGDIVVDPAGIVRLHWIGSGPADRPSVDELLSVVQ